MSVVHIKEVDVAAHHLHDLATRMRSDLFGFNGGDVEHIDEVIDALHDLDIHRSKAVEILETETIKGSALRHKLMHYPTEINLEIERAVGAARALNEDVINDLKRQLQELCDQINYFETHSDAMDKETIDITPERDAILAVYEEVVARLNERLADKADTQINLNTNMEKVRVANVAIVDYEEDIVRLKEEMIAVRNETQNIKKKLADETNEQVRLFNEQKARNDERRQEYNTLAAKEAQISARLAELKSINSQLLTTNKSLEKQEKSLTESIAKQRQRRLEMEKEIEMIKAKTKAMAEEHRRQMAEMKAALEDFQKRIKRETERKEVYNGKKGGLKEVLEQALIVREEDAKTVRELNEKLQEAKATLASKAEDMGGLQQEMFDMQNRMIELAEAHRSTVLVYNKQIATLKEQLSREQKERLIVQTDNDELQKTIDVFTKKQNDFMKDMNKQITERKQLHHALNDEHTNLSTQIRDDVKRRQMLEEAIERTTAEFAEMKKRKEELVEFLETDLVRLHEEHKIKSEELAILLPKFAEFESFYDQAMKDYDALKRSLVALKNRKMGLEEGSQRTTVQIDKLKTTLSDLEREKSRKSEMSVEQLQAQAQETADMEKSIYVLGCKLKTAVEENARMEAAILRFEAGVRSMREQFESGMRRKARVRQQLTAQQKQLVNAWAADLSMQNEFILIDEHLLEILAEILQSTEDREERLTRVTEALETEITKLACFLQTDSVSSNSSQAVVVDIEDTNQFE